MHTPSAEDEYHKCFFETGPGDKTKSRLEASANAGCGLPQSGPAIGCRWRRLWFQSIFIEQSEAYWRRLGSRILFCVFIFRPVCQLTSRRHNRNPGVSAGCHLRLFKPRHRTALREGGCRMVLYMAPPLGMTRRSSNGWCVQALVSGGGYGPSTGRVENKVGVT